MTPETEAALARYRDSLPGAVALVTGGGSGIGRAAALALAEAGADLGLVGRRREPLEETASMIRQIGRRAEVRVADVGQADTLESAIGGIEAALGPITIAVAAAGINAWGSLETLAPERLRQALATNLEGVANLARLVVPGMTERGAGKLIVVASDAGRKPAAGGSGYTATKWGAVGLALSLSRELLPAGVGVHVIEPGCVDTDWYAANTAAPRERMLTPEDVALAIMFAATLPAHVVLEELLLIPRRLEVEGWD
jgi:NADP-dependent 3-hydroxy acid dehydrogenase YdfG